MSVNKRQLRKTSRTEYLTAIDPSDKATKRVIAPYLKIIRKTPKPPVSEIIQTDKQLSIILDKKPTVLLQNLSALLSDDGEIPFLIYETVTVLKTIAKASGASLYMVDVGNEELYLSHRNEMNIRDRVNWKIQEGTIIAAYVALRREFVMVDDTLGDDRFPSGIGYIDHNIRAVLSVPVVTPENVCIAVVEMYRERDESSFSKNDLKITIIVSAWIGAAIFHNRAKTELQTQQQVNDYFLALVKYYFSDCVTLDQIINEIVKFAKTTLLAEKGMFFVMDPETNDLTADVYEEGIDNADILHRKNVRVKLRRDQSIAGLVARTKVVINIRDAHNDSRFVTDINQRGGFLTRSVLCIPILSVEGVLGVLQVVNKKTGAYFTANDEELMKTFSTYCGLILHYAKLQNTVRKLELVNAASLDLLEVHMKPCSHDMDRFIKKPEVKIASEFYEFKWYISPEKHPDMPQYILFMTGQILGVTELKLENFMEFILSVKKSYRNNPYHNFEHAFNVAHCMFNILQRNAEKFTDVELKAFLLAALCHDLDHSGYTNNFLQLTNDTLAQLYDESPLEHHHYDTAVLLLSRNEIFQKVPADTYKAVLKEMKTLILATDLANHFKFRVKLMNLTDDELIDWNNARHRYLIKSLVITTCDLSGCCKPYPIARKIIENICREFYHQGDIEKNMGLTPLSLMDREKNLTIPEDQVQFLSVVVLPCVDLLQAILPNTHSLYTEALILKRTWQEIIELRGQKSWRQADSIVHRKKM